MAIFNYKVIDQKKQIRYGEIEAENLEQASDFLLSQNLTILQLKKKGIDLETLQKINIGGIPLKEKVTFIRQLAFMVEAGIPLVQALEISREQTNNLYFKDVVKKIKETIEGGSTLSKALSAYTDIFDPLEINLIKAGEESGNLDKILTRVTDELEKKADFQARVQGALMYPAIVLIIIIVVVILLMTSMIPQMSELYESMNLELPLATQIVVNISKFITSWGGIVLLVAILFAFGSLFYYYSTPSGKKVLDKLVLKIPIAGEIIGKSQVVSFANTFSMLLNAGIPIVDALNLVGNSLSNKTFQDAIEECAKKVEKGIPLSAPLLANPDIPPLLGHMIRVGEEIGKVDEVTFKVGVQFQKEVDNLVNNLNKLMEPMILILMGVVVGGLAIAVYLPIFNLATAIGMPQ